MGVQLRQKSIRSLLPTDILFQTMFWGRVKSHLGWNALAFDMDSSAPKGDLLVLTRSCGNNRLSAYVPQGPESRPDQESYGVFLERLSIALAGHLGPSAAFIRYDLPWESQYTREGKNNASFELPEARVREMRMNIGTSMWNLRKAALDMTVAESYVVDLECTEECILDRMKPKTRYNVRLAERREVVVETALADMLPDFYNLYRQTATRQGFSACPYHCFSTFFTVSVADDLAPKLLFLLARRGSDLLAGGIFAISCNTAHFLFGASSDQHKHLMGSYALHWAAIRRARALGCHRYDMGAISPTKEPSHPFYGLYRFKTGFGGEIVHRNGSWDYPLDQQAYTAFRNAEILNREMLI